jgi:hypothetical protein
MYKLMTLIFLLLPALTHAHQNFDETRQEILTILQTTTPTAVQPCKALFAQYDTLVTNFFDKKNTESLAAHVKHMREGVAALHTACHDVRFKSVHVLFKRLHKDVSAMVDTCASYVGARITLFFALAMKKFKFLMPAAIQNKGDFAVFRCLSHRLSCL